MINIFICMTPLHLLISEKILEQKINKVNFLIYIPNRNTEQNKHYFDRVNCSFHKAYYNPIDKNLFIYLYEIIKVCLKLRNDDKINYFVGNLKSVFSRLPMLITGYKEINIFDDGFANILPNSFLYQPEKKYIKIFFKIFNSRLEYEIAQNSIKKYYTIFKNNQILNHTYIELFKNTSSINSKNTRSILLTSPFSEYKILDTEEESNLYKKVIQEYSITDVLMHPNEKKIKISEINILNDIFIAEEYVSMLSKTSNIIVYAFYSTALLNLSLNDNLNIICLHYKKIHTIKNKIIFNSLDIKVKEISL